LRVKSSLGVPMAIAIGVKPKRFAGKFPIIP
jgi:hypothetical protein